MKMSSPVNNKNDPLFYAKNCVLIDGDFGRHELFINVQPYTLHRLAKLNDAVAFQNHTRHGMG